MKRILLVALLLCSLCVADEKRVAGASRFTILDRNVAWSTFAVSRTYVLDATSPDVGVCLTLINNNPTNARTVSLGAAITPDAAQTTYAGSTGAFVSVSPNGAAFTMSVAASGSFQTFVSSQGAAHTIIQLGSQGGVAGGSPDTVTVLATQGNGCASGASTSAGPSNPGALQVLLGFQWTVVSAPAAAAQATVAKAAAPGVRHTLQSYSISLDNSAATAAGHDFVVRDGACGAGAIIWQTRLSIPATIGSQSSQTQTGLNVVGTAGNAMCFEFTAAPPAGITQRISGAGIDQ